MSIIAPRTCLNDRLVKGYSVYHPVTSQNGVVGRTKKKRRRRYDIGFGVTLAVVRDFLIPNFLRIFLGGGALSYSWAKITPALRGKSYHV